MLRYDFDQSLIYWTCTTAHALERALNEELAPHGITYRQWQVLGWLVLEGTLSQSELAERMRIDAPTLAGILDRMERDGWLARETCSADRRKKHLRLTEKVEPIWSRIAEAGRRVRIRAGRGFRPEQHQQLIATLAAIQENLRGPTEQPEGSS
ncbi:MarR family transcriptional regulator [soil metagenome]